MLHPLPASLLLSHPAKQNIPLPPAVLSADPPPEGWSPAAPPDRPCSSSVPAETIPVISDTRQVWYLRNHAPTFQFHRYFHTDSSDYSDRPAPLASYRIHLRSETARWMPALWSRLLLYFYIRSMFLLPVWQSDTVPSDDFSEFSYLPILPSVTIFIV